MDGEFFDQVDLLVQLEMLKEEYEVLNVEVDVFVENGVIDQLKFVCMKKEKLRFKDEISKVVDQIMFDIIV